jgi:hypothetical protein
MGQEKRVLWYHITATYRKEPCPTVQVQTSMTGQRPQCARERKDVKWDNAMQHHLRNMKNGK